MYKIDFYTSQGTNIYTVKCSDKKEGWEVYLRFARDIVDNGYLSEFIGRIFCTEEEKVVFLRNYKRDTNTWEYRASTCKDLYNE